MVLRKWSKVLLQIVVHFERLQCAVLMLLIFKSSIQGIARRAKKLSILVPSGQDVEIVVARIEGIGALVSEFREVVQRLISSALEDASAAVHQDDVRELAEDLGSWLVNGAEDRLRRELFAVHRLQFEFI